MLSGSCNIKFPVPQQGSRIVLFDIFFEKISLHNFLTILFGVKYEPVAFLDATFIREIYKIPKISSFFS